MKVVKFLLVLATILLIASGAGAQNWVVLQLPYADYGHLYNTANGMLGGGAKPYCAPTATANSFQFLENHYPSIYTGSPLTGGNLLQLRDSLATGWTGLDGVQHTGMVPPAALGATWQDWWEHKVWWIEDYAPGTTTFKGMVEIDPANWYQGTNLTLGKTTWDFLWGEISHGENVEIGIDFQETPGHALTLSSMKFFDANSNGVWDNGEAREIDYLDPNDPTQLYWGAVSNNLKNGRLEFLWQNSFMPVAKLATIELAYCESVPEPSGLIALAAGLTALGAMIRRRS